MSWLLRNEEQGDADGVAALAHFNRSIPAVRRDQRVVYVTISKDAL